MITEPVNTGFEYEVFIGIAIPTTWAELIKETGRRHYDHVCQAAADHGCVNGFFNLAAWNAKREDGKVTTRKISWRDCDTICKIMEQAHYTTENFGLIDQIVKYFKDVMQRLENRSHDLNVKLGGG